MPKSRLGSEEPTAVLELHPLVTRIPIIIVGIIVTIVSIIIIGITITHIASIMHGDSFVRKISL